MTIAEPDLQLIESAVQQDGEFSGWSYFPRERFNHHVGPFYHKLAQTQVICAFRASEKNGNGVGLVHGGSLLTFADYCMYVTAQAHYGTMNVVTAALSSEFLGAARPGELIEARSEIMSAGGSLMVIRGVVTADRKKVLNFSGTFKRLARVSPFKNYPAN